MYYSYIHCRDNDIEECSLEMFFTVDHEVFGELKSYDLKPDGSEVPVTEENKHEYIQLMTEWRFNRGVEEQKKAFLDGFQEVVPLHWLQYFDERELEVCPTAPHPRHLVTQVTPRAPSRNLHQVYYITVVCLHHV